MDEEVLNLRDQVGVLRRRWRLIAAVVVLAIGAALLLAFVQTPKYQGTATLLVEPTQGTSANNGVVVDPTEVLTQVSVLTSLPVATRVVASLRLDESPETLLKDVTVAPVSTERVLVITALRTNADEAAAVANAFADQYIAFRQDETAANFNALRTQYSQQLTALRRQLQTLGTKIADPNNNDDPLLRARRSTLLVQQTDIATRLAALAPTSATGSPEGQVLLRAQVPTAPVQPKPIRMALLGAVLGLVLGVGLAFVRDHLDDAIRDEGRLRQAGGGLAILGRIPRASRAQTSRVGSLIDPSSQLSEAFRALNTNVRFLLAARTHEPSARQPQGILLVTSAVAAEGKTSVAANLAIAAARVGLTVILVDADLRRPLLAEKFGFRGVRGLADALAEGGPIEAYLLDVNVDGLSVLPGGSVPPNPAELLASPQCGFALATLSSKADLVIVDSAPILGVADSLELISKADLILLVARRRLSRLRSVNSALERIARLGRPVDGIVLNDVDSGGSYSYS